MSALMIILHVNYIFLSSKQPLILVVISIS